MCLLVVACVWCAHGVMYSGVLCFGGVCCYMWVAHRLRASSVGVLVVCYRLFLHVGLLLRVLWWAAGVV